MFIPWGSAFLLITALRASKSVITGQDKTVLILREASVYAVGKLWAEWLVMHRGFMPSVFNRLMDRVKRNLSTGLRLTCG